MQLHDVRTADLSNKKPMRVGRGSGSGKGKTCGRGREGATSRSGWSMKPTYEGGQMPLFRRLPKRGFTNGPFKKVNAVLNIGDLKDFPADTRVDEAALRKAGLVKGPKGRPVKLLSDGELTVALTVVADKFSKSAREKIEKAGGKVEYVKGAPKKKAPNFVADAKMKRVLATAKEVSQTKPIHKGKTEQQKKSAKAGK